MPYYIRPCPFCNKDNEIQKNECKYCGRPFEETVNVRRALIPEEQKVLKERYDSAKEDLQSKGLENIGIDFENLVSAKGKAVINLPFSFLWEMLMHDTAYTSYRRQVIEESRERAEYENDLDRSIVESFLFGSHVDIIYAALTLNETGLSSYGGVSIIIQTFPIERRTSLLDRNSFVFFDESVEAG